MSDLLPRISIVGYGRFGTVLHRLLKDDFAVTVYRRSEITDRSEFTPTTNIAKKVSDIYLNDTVFFAVPIDSFARVIASHAKYFTDKHVLIDVLSVKLHPAAVFEKYLKKSRAQAVLTHPMFGPDSSMNGFEHLPLVMCKFQSCDIQFTFWKNYFSTKNLNVVEMSPDAHDRLAANSQGLTHIIGRMLEKFDLEKTSIDSLGTKKLLDVKALTCKDTWQLFVNLQKYNPYTAEMRVRLGQAYADICKSVRDERKV